MISASEQKKEWMPSAHWLDHPLSFFDWATPRSEQIQGPRGSRKRPSQSLHPLQQDKRIKVGQDQPSAGEVISKQVKQSQPRQRLNLSQLEEIPHPLCYTSPLPLVPTTRPPTLPTLGTTLPPHFTIIKVPHHIIAGRLRLFINNRKILTKEIWVHKTIEGFHIPLESPPRPTDSREWTLSKDIRDTLNQELFKLLERSIITPTVDNSTIFLSPIFTIPKKNGEQWLIINLKNLNKFIRKQHFKMEGAHLLRDLPIKDDWMVKIDLKEAYYIVLIHQNLRVSSVFCGMGSPSSSRAYHLVSTVPREFLPKC